MLRTIHKILLILATGNYLTLANIQSKYNVDISTSVSFSSTILIILIAIWMVDIVLNLTGYIRGTAEGVVKDTIKNPVKKIISSIFKG